MEGIVLNTPTLLFFLLYFSSFIIIAFLSKSYGKNHTTRDYLTGDSSFGKITLFLTLFATTFSGLTFIGGPGFSYRNGFLFYIFATVGMGYVLGLVLLGPAIRKLHAKKKYITGVDFIADRFKHPLLTKIATYILIYAASMYLISQLQVIGRVFQGFSNGQNLDQWYLYGTLFLAIIMVVYESIGGFRAVVWTDTLQACLMSAGLIGAVFIFSKEFINLPDLLVYLKTTPELKYLISFSKKKSIIWVFSYFFMGLFAFSIYPQTFQRIIGAESINKFLKSIKYFMLTLPLMLILPLFLGLVGHYVFPGLSDIGSEYIFPLMLKKMMSISHVYYWIGILVFCSILAAILSSGDSFLIAIVALVTKNIIIDKIKNNSDRTNLVISKMISFLILSLLVGLAFLLRYFTLISIFDMTMNLLCQLAPAFFLGIYMSKIKGSSIVPGLLLGALFVVYFAGFNVHKIWEIHTGVIGIIINFITVFIHHYLHRIKAIKR